MAFQKALTRLCQRDRALFCAPIVVALGLLFLITQNQAALAAAWRNPLSVLSERSPGERSPGALYNVKPQRKLADERLKQALGNFPQERVLAASRVRPSPFDDFLPDDIPQDLFPESAPTVAGVMPLDLDLPPAISGGPPSFGSPLRGIVPGAAPAGEESITEPESPPTSTPETPSTPTPESTTPSEVPVTAVPEPTTWAMQILGLFLVAGMMRARNRKIRVLRPAAAFAFQG